MIKLLKDQTFWLGVMTALAGMFFLLFAGVVTEKVSFDTGSKKGYAAPKVADTGNNVAPPTAAPEITVEPLNDGDWVRGAQDAPVTVVEFSDIDCPFCNRFHDTMNQVVADYDGQVNWAYRDFPLDALHPEARAKAIAAECVGNIGGNDLYWQYLDGLFVSSAADELTAEAQKLGIDMTAFASCQEDTSVAQEVQDDEAAGSLAGAQGTPYSVILVGDEKFVVNGAQPYSEVKKKIDAALATL